MNPSAREAGVGVRGGASSLRAQHSRATRRAVVEAATHLFVEQGYAGTTIDAVAARAGVGRKTVFTSVGGKGTLLKLAWDWALAGDDETVPMAQRAAVQAILAERDPSRVVRGWVDMVVDVASRAAPIGVVVLAAADVDADVRALRDTIRRESLTGARAFVAHLAAVGGLRPGTTVDRAADVCWALVNSLLLNLLVSGRGWATHDYRDWLVQVVHATLTEPPGPSEPRPAPPVVVSHRPDRDRYEAHVDGRAAGHLSYQRTDALVVATRTAVEPGFADGAVADALVRRLFEDVRSAGRGHVVPVCPYVTWWVSRNPDAAAMVFAAADA